MDTKFDPEYFDFDAYKSEVLDPQPKIQQLSTLDSELLNIEYLGRYANELGPNEWSRLERYYNSLFREFITERVQSAARFDEDRISETEFSSFRRHIAELNHDLPSMPSRSTTTISKPAERLLTKRLRKQQYDPESLDVPHLARGGGLYLLELFITAGRQDAATDTDLLATLLEEARQLQSHDEQRVRRLLSAPVLMVSLWENQQDGLDRWLSCGREGILEMATATGKTVVGIAAIADLCGDIPDRPDQRPRTTDADIMVVAHSNAILSQWAAEIAEKLGLSASTLTGSGQPDSLSFSSGEVEFYTAQSLLPHYDPDLKSHYDLVIYDEVHHYSNAEGYGAAIQRPEYDAALGLSATIGGEDSAKRRTIEDLLAPVIFTYDIEDATRDGIIPDFEWTVHPARLSPRENSEWEDTSESISSTFAEITGSRETTRTLRKLSVPFTTMEDLGDFLQAYQAAQLELDDDDDPPEEWEQLQALIQSRNWIRHRSQPKFEAGVDLAKDYLDGGADGPKIVMFAMDIETTEKIGEALSEVCENVFTVHSKIAASNAKKDRLVRERINRFADVDKGVLIAPKLLDEGIDVPDAEVGINVAGTKTKLQLVQRMGRVLRRHGDQRPHFHHFIAVPHEHEVRGLDEKQYVQRRNWVRELGEAIGEQPTIEDAAVDMDVVDRANERGNELWARDLLSDLEIETVQGSIRLEQLVQDIDPGAARTLHDSLDLDGAAVSTTDWEAALDRLRADPATTIETLQRIWWLFPIYRDQPGELDRLLTGILEEHPDVREQTTSDRDNAGADSASSTHRQSDTGHGSRNHDPENHSSGAPSSDGSQQGDPGDGGTPVEWSYSGAGGERGPQQEHRAESDDSGKSEDQSLTDRIESVLGKD